MKPRFTSVVPLSLLLAAFTFAAPHPASAQEQPATANHEPPPIVEVITEVLKPGQSGSPHMKTEAAFVQAMRDAKWPEHYFGLDSLTGRTRAVFLVGYNNFADMQNDMDAMRKNVSLASAFDSASVADGALLDASMTSIYHFRKDLSLNAGANIGTTRYFELTVFRVRSGHEKDWRTVVKMYQDAYAKIPNAHWDMFAKMYGENSGGTYLLAVPMKSLAEEDVSMANDAKLKDVVGAEQLEKMEDLANATVESVVSNLFAINPKMSYANEAWTKADPTFWGQ